MAKNSKTTNDSANSENMKISTKAQNRGFRPLGILAVAMVSIAAIEGARLALHASNAFAEGKENKADAAADAAASANVDANANNATLPSCLPVDLSKENNLSAAEFRLLQSLQDRRQQLDARERDIITREGVLKTADNVVQAKIDNLKMVEAEIQKLLGQVDDMEAQRLANLVKVYEKMKPKDAAKVMEGMSDEVVIPIASKMKDQALALILAKMDPSRARQITAKLAQVDTAELPQYAKASQQAANNTPAAAPSAPAAPAATPNNNAASSAANPQKAATPPSLKGGPSAQNQNPSNPQQGNKK